MIFKRWGLQMRKLLRLKRIYLLGLIPCSLFIILAAKHSSYFAEEIYAKIIYKGISQILSLITGIFPFSLTELIVILAPITVIIILIKFIIQIIRNKQDRLIRLGKGFINLLCMGSVLLFLFTILTGVNYYRYSFTYYSDLVIEKASVEELYALTDSLAVTAMELRDQVTTDEQDVFKLSMDYYKLAKEANKAYNSLSEEYKILGGYYGKAKPVLLSEFMSSTEITGIFFPFTMEANVNVHVSDYTIPHTMLHELAHLRGFMREDEANYLAYLAGMKSEHKDLQYSSIMAALVTSGNALYKEDRTLYWQIFDQLSDGVKKDIRANSEYWVKYEDTVISTISSNINNTYLKANNQSDGVKSYGRMLDLLIAEYRKEQEDR